MRAAVARRAHTPARFESSHRRHTFARAAREAIGDNRAVCGSAQSADCRALPSRSISSGARTTRRPLWTLSGSQSCSSPLLNRGQFRSCHPIRVAHDPQMLFRCNSGSSPGGSSGELAAYRSGSPPSPLARGCWEGCATLDWDDGCRLTRPLLRPLIIVLIKSSHELT